jgi:bacillithiol system protein YtxJ
LIVSEMNIRKIRNIAEWETLLEEAGGRPVWLFKHSLTCPLSSEGRNEFERFAADGGAESAVLAMIEVQNSRELSNELARRLGVRHETPQAILLLGDRVCWHGSHWNISTSTLARADREAVAAVGAGGE